MISMSREWVEANVYPSSPEQRERLLLDVIDPLIHEKLAGRIDTWFYFWESTPPPSHLRLRIRWQRLEHADQDPAELFAFLDAARNQGRLEGWYEGSHGEKGKTYEGEAERYGPEMWDITCRDWMSGSELALAMLKLGSENRLTEPLKFHWERRVHLFSNQLGFGYADEISMCLRQARGYLALGNTNDPRIASFINVIGQIQIQLSSSVDPAVRE
jgi:Lantibiotic biosynthesis dehydratase C-term